jgi:hypothetical protein
MRSKMGGHSKVEKVELGPYIRGTVSNISLKRFLDFFGEGGDIFTATQGMGF